MAILEIHLLHKEILSLNHDLSTGGAVGVVSRVTRNVPDKGIVDSFAECECANAFKGCDRGRRQIQKHVVGMKPGEMNRDIRAEFAHYPVHELLQHLVGIVQSGDDQVDDLEMDTALGNLLDAAQHGGQLHAADIAIERFIETLEVDFDGVQNSAHIRQWLRIHETAADQQQRRFCLRPASAMSTRYSVKTVGSLYVKAITGADWETVAFAISAGLMRGVE